MLLNFTKKSVLNTLQVHNRNLSRAFPVVARQIVKDAGVMNFSPGIDGDICGDGMA